MAWEKRRLNWARARARGCGRGEERSATKGYARERRGAARRQDMRWKRIWWGMRMGHVHAGNVVWQPRGWREET